MKIDLGIVGGLGPLASSYLYEMITKKTKANKDQDHLNIALLSIADTPDRTAYIIKKSDKSPYPNLLEACKTLESIGAKLITIPCNTSLYFYDKLSKEINIPISNMIKNTVKFLKENDYQTVSIMATTGTIETGLYQKELEANNINYVLPNQEIVMQIIYDYVKKGKEVPQQLFDKAIENIDAEAYILGCTELSVLKEKLNLDDKFIDPLEIETTNILKYFNKL